MTALRWTGTVLCMIGFALSAADMYPYNVVFSAAGSSCWMVYGVRRGDVPMWLVELSAVAIGLAGLAFWLVKKVLGA